MSSPRPFLDGLTDANGNVLAYVAPQSYFTEHYGRRMVGRVLAVLVYGVSFSVCAHYFMSPDFQADSMASRCYIILLSVMNTAATVTVTMALISESFAQERTIAFLAIPDLVQPLWSLFFAMTVILAQLFLARRAFLVTVYVRSPTHPHRAWKARGPILVFVLLLATIVASIIGYTINVSLSFKHYAVSDRFSALEICALAGALLASAATDVIITATLGWHWVRFLRHNEGFNKRTDSLLRKLIAFTLSTASYTTIPAVIGAILKASAPDTSSHSSIVIALPQLHATAAFLALDVRRSLRRDRFLQPGAPTLPTLPAAKTLSASIQEPSPESIYEMGSRVGSLESGESRHYIIGKEPQPRCVRSSEADKGHDVGGSANV